MAQFKDRWKIRAVAGLMVDQAKRSVRRPSRLLFVPFLLPSYFPRLLTLFLAMLPVRWPHGERGKAFRLAVGNLVLLRHDRPEHAWYWMQRVLGSARRSTEEYFLGAVCLYQGLGRLGEATALFKRANDFDFQKAQALGVAQSPYRVLDEVWARHIGDAATLDYVIKQRIPWKAIRARTPSSMRRPGAGSATAFCCGAGGALCVWSSVRQICRSTRRRRGAALPLSISAAGRRQHGLFLGAGEQRPPTLAKRRPRPVAGAAAGRRNARLGVAAGGRRTAWRLVRGAACARHHLERPQCRYPRHSQRRHRGLFAGDRRNNRPRRLCRAHGRSRRAADAPAANVIDYCRSDMRSDWMDIFLIARSRFMLGSASGPSFVPPLYGVPAVLTNWWPPGMRPWHACDIFIPKMLRRLADGRYLTLSETLQEPFSHCHSPRYLREHEGVHVEDNDPELIRGAVAEMLSRLDGDAGPDADVAELQARADRIYQLHGYFGAAGLARDFLRRHGDFVV